MWEILRRSLATGIQTGRPMAEPPPGVPRAPLAPAGEIELLGEALHEETRRLFRRSMRLRHVDAGSCNACESEIAALLGPVWDLQRFGLDLVASPRHADALLVTGPPARHLEEALRLTVEATPRPRLVIALGDCACHGGFCRDSFAVLPGVAAAMPVDVRIPGCPPPPDEILRGILAGLGRAAVLGAAGR
jgi:Ni,Fe-hydrogenase III small subunit